MIPILCRHQQITPVLVAPFVYAPPIGAGFVRSCGFRANTGDQHAVWVAYD